MAAMSGQKEPRPVNHQIVRCIDKGLSALGEAVKAAALWHIEHVYDIRLERVAEEPERFIGALDRVFGDASRVIVSVILNEIRRTFGIAVDGDFSRTIRELTQGGSAGFIGVGE